MQDGLSPSPAWLQSAFGWIASFVAGGTIFKLVDVWLNRKKPAAEVHVTHATAQEITVRSHMTAGEALAKMMDRLDQAQATIDKVRDESSGWEMKAFDLQMELKDVKTINAQLIAQATLDNYQIRRQMAFIEMKNLKDEYIALDLPKEQSE